MEQEGGLGGVLFHGRFFHCLVEYQWSMLNHI
jgi:hypothetical protein